MAKIELENKILEFPIGEIKSDPIFLIKSFSDLTNALNNIKKEYNLKFFYLNRKIIKNILYDADKYLKIGKESINEENLNSFYYLYYIIIDDIYNINYTYDIDVINELYLKMMHEENQLRKFIIYILAFPILYNFEGFNENLTSSDKKKIKTIYNNIEEFMQAQQPLLDEFDLDLDLSNYGSFNIDDIYANIIISLIRNQKLENVKYSKNIFEQLDLENIELSHEIYAQIKNEFDKNSNKEYINCYKIDNFEKFIKKTNINFYYILFKYIFKVPIYIYNIQFLLNTRKVVLEFSKNDFYKILLEIIKFDFKEKIIYVLKVFLDLEYHFLINKLLIEIEKYFENYLYESREEKIKEIENKIKEKNEHDFFKYLSYYPEAKKLNKRYEIIKYIATIKKRKLPKTFKEFEKYIKQWKESEKLINDKRFNKIKNKKYLFIYFNDINNKNILLQIFDKQKIDHFIDKYNDTKNLRIIVKYYELYYFESKEKDITKINDFLKFNTRLKQQDYKRYINDLDLAKEMINKYKLINSIVGAKNISKNEKELQLNLENWKNIQEMLEEKNIDSLDDKTKIELINFFDKKHNQKNFGHFIKEDSYKFLLEQKNKLIQEILNYYKDFFPESKKKEIELIEHNNIQEKILENYSEAKRYNMRKPLIFLLLDQSKNDNESGIKKGVDKWNRIEEEINKKEFQNINKAEREKLIKFINEADHEFIYKIFDKKIIEEFINFDEQMSEISSSSTTTTTQKKKNKTNRIKKVKAKNKNKSKNQSKSDLSYSKSSSSNKLDQSTYFEREEEKELNQLDNKIDLIFKYILKFDLIFLLKGENEDKNKNIKIKFKGNNKFLLYKSDFDSYKENFSNNKSSKGYKIFEFLSEFIKKLLNEYINNFLLKLELHIEEKENEFIFSYKFLRPLNKEPLHFKDFNYLSEGFEYLLNEINDEKYKIEEIEKEQILHEKKENVKNEDNNNDKKNNLNEKISIYKDPSQTINNELSRTLFNKTSLDLKGGENENEQREKAKYKIIEFIQEMGNHNHNGKHTAEFIKEIIKNKEFYFISGGDDKTLKLYGPNFSKKKELENKYAFYDICEKLSGNNLEFYLCTNNQLIKYKYDFKPTIQSYEFDDSYPSFSNDDKCLSILGIRGKGINKLIIACQTGVLLYDYPDNIEKKGRMFQKTKDKSYKGLIQIDKKGDLIALTSNEILPGGENKLLIYNLKDDKLECIKQIENYSFIAKANGMATIYLEDNYKEEEYLICACKKYSEDLLPTTQEKTDQKNGILLVNIQKDYIDFYDTKEFEVYCFCPIVGKVRALGTVFVEINAQNHAPEGTRFFLAGGFDTILGEGKIKLFKLIDGENTAKKIKFLQDIEIDKYEPEIIKTASNNGEAKEDEKGGENKVKTEKKDNTNKDGEHFTGFHGAISSIIQSTIEKYILVSCYDGKICLFSKPNLELYNLELDYN